MENYFDDIMGKLWTLDVLMDIEKQFSHSETGLPTEYEFEKFVLEYKKEIIKISERLNKGERILYFGILKKQLPNEFMGAFSILLKHVKVEFLENEFPQIKNKVSPNEFQLTKEHIHFISEKYSLYPFYKRTLNELLKTVIQLEEGGMPLQALNGKTKIEILETKQSDSDKAISTEIEFHLNKINEISKDLLSPGVLDNLLSYNPLPLNDISILIEQLLISEFVNEIQSVIVLQETMEAIEATSIQLGSKEQLYRNSWSLSSKLPPNWEPVNEILNEINQGFIRLREIALKIYTEKIEQLPLPDLVGLINKQQYLIKRREIVSGIDVNNKFQCDIMMVACLANEINFRKEMATKPEAIKLDNSLQHEQQENSQKQQENQSIIPIVDTTDLTKKIKSQYKVIFEEAIRDINESRINPQSAKDNEFTALASILYRTDWIHRGTSFADWLRTFSVAYNKPVPKYKESQVKKNKEKLFKKAPFLEFPPYQKLKQPR